jgi:hypothetical protein
MTRAEARAMPALVSISSSAESPAGGADARRVKIERDVLEALGFEHAPHVLADAAETAEDDVLALGNLLSRRLFALGGGEDRCVLVQQKARHALVVVEDHRTQHHREHDRNQQRLDQPLGGEPGLQQHRAERDAELPADRHHDARAQCLEARVSEGQCHESGDHRFEDYDRDQHEKRERELARFSEQVQVEQHPHRDEEQSQQQVAERPDGRIDLVTVLGLGEHHAGKKGTECEGQSAQV